MYGIKINDLIKSSELVPTQIDLSQEVKVKARVEAEAEVVAIEVDLINEVIHVIEE